MAFLPAIQICPTENEKHNQDPSRAAQILRHKLNNIKKKKRILQTKAIRLL